MTATPKKKSPPKKTAPKKRVVKKKVVKKKAGKKKTTPKTPIPKYHVNRQSWDKEAAMEEICHKLSTSSKGLARICDDKELPAVSTVLGWLEVEAKNNVGKLLDMYARAKENQADFMADEIIDIADNYAGEPLLVDGEPVVVNGQLIKVTTAASVNHARLRVDSRKFIASKLKPRVYGDKLELSGDQERPLSGLTEEQLVERRKQLENKLGELNQ